MLNRAVALTTLRLDSNWRLMSLTMIYSLKIGSLAVDANLPPATVGEWGHVVLQSVTQCVNVLVWILKILSCKVEREY